MKMNTQVMIYLVVFFQVLAGAATLTNIHHGDVPIDIPGDGSSDVDIETTGSDEKIDDSVEDPEMPAGDSESMDAAAEAEGSEASKDVDADEDEDNKAVQAAVAQAEAVLPPPSPPAHQQHPAAKTNARKVKVVQKAMAVPKKHLRAAPAQHLEAPVSDSSIASMHDELQKEHSLRLDAERLVKKLTSALNHTTDVLKKKDREVASELRSQSAEEARLKVVEGTLSSERASRTAAERNVSNLAARMQRLSQHGNNQAKLEKNIEELKAEEKKLSADDAEAHKELESLKDNVDEAEAARKAKTQEWKDAVKQVELLKKKDKSDIADLEHKEQQTMEALKKHFMEEEANQTAGFEKKKKAEEDAIAKLKKEASDLNQTDVKLEKQVSQEQKLTKHELERAETAEKKTASEHKAFLQAESQIAAQKANLTSKDKKMQQLQAQADKVKKLSQTIGELNKASSELNKSNVEEKNALQTALSKLEDTEDALKVVQQEVKEAKRDLKDNSQAEHKAHERVQEVLKVLKSKNAQLEIDEEEVQSLRSEVSAVAEQKNALVKALTQVEAKLAKKADEEKELAAAHLEIANFNKTLAAKDQALAAKDHQIKEAEEKTQEINAVKATLALRAAEEKDLVDQLSSAKQQEKDKMAAAAAKEQELNMALSAAYGREKELKGKTNQQAEELKKKDKEVHAAWEEEAKIKANRLTEALNAEQQEVGEPTSVHGKNVSKAALLAGKAVLRSRDLQRELESKDKQLKVALAEIQGLQVQMGSQDVQLEESRKALLHAASIKLPSATAQEAAAARKALETVNGKLDAQTRELSASQTELAASKTEMHVEKDELQVLKDDHTHLTTKVKKLSDSLISQNEQKKKLNKEVTALKTNISHTEKERQDALKHTAELEKVVAASKKQAAQAAAAQAAATKNQEAAQAQAAQTAQAAQAAQAAQEAQAAQAAQAAKTADQAAQEQGQEQEEQQAPAPPQQQSESQPKQSSAGDSDDDSDQEDSDSLDSIATVPWGNIQDRLKKNLRTISN